MLFECRDLRLGLERRLWVACRALVSPWSIMRAVKMAVCREGGGDACSRFNLTLCPFERMCGLSDFQYVFSVSLYCSR